MDLARATSVFQNFVGNDSRFRFSKLESTGIEIGLGTVRPVSFHDARIGIINVDADIGDTGLLLTLTSRQVTFEVLSDDFDEWIIFKSRFLKSQDLLLTQESEFGSRSLCLSSVLVPQAVGPKSVSAAFDNLAKEVNTLEFEISGTFNYEFDGAF